MLLNTNTIAEKLFFIWMAGIFDSTRDLNISNILSIFLFWWNG